MDRAVLPILVGSSATTGAVRSPFSLRSQRSGKTPATSKRSRLMSVHSGAVTRVEHLRLRWAVAIYCAVMWALLGWVWSSFWRAGQ